MWADVETGGYQGRPQALHVIFISHCFFLLFEEKKTNLVGSGVVSSRERAPEKRARADGTAKVTSAGIMTELLSEKKNNVLDLTVRAD